MVIVYVPHGVSDRCPTMSTLSANAVNVPVPMPVNSHEAASTQVPVPLHTTRERTPSGNAPEVL